MIRVAKLGLYFETSKKFGKKTTASDVDAVVLLHFAHHESRLDGS
jgi:hypothetical protein